MKIIDVINFYYNHYNKLKLRVEMANGLYDRGAVYTKEEAIDSIEGYFDEEVMMVHLEEYSSYYDTYNHANYSKKDFPSLTIIYKNPIE